MGKNHLYVFLRKLIKHAVPAIPESLKAGFVDVPAAGTTFCPCTQVLALVESSETSSLQQAGAGGFKITTNNVKDLLHDTSEAHSVQLTSFCTLENLQDFKLDPPRTRTNKKQAAIVLISSVLQVSSADHQLPLSIFEQQKMTDPIRMVYLRAFDDACFDNRFIWGGDFNTGLVLLHTYMANIDPSTS